LLATSLLKILGCSSNEEIIQLFSVDRKSSGVPSNQPAKKQANEISAIINTLNQDPYSDFETTLKDLYQKNRPNDPQDLESAKLWLYKLLVDERRYNLGNTGRFVINRKLGLSVPANKKFLQKEDVVSAIKYLLKLGQGKVKVDDIDNLANRRVRTVGELLEEQFCFSLTRLERTVKEKMFLLSHNRSDKSAFDKNIKPHNLINHQIISAMIRDFFGRSQLSQFMDQTNPLAELTHKRRLSALGPGGLSRKRAGFEVRDVHPSHYGRICPIETPEGPNIGLISSLSTYARVGRFGFLETPYRKVKKGKVSSHIEYLSADKEDKYVIAQANARIDSKGHFLDPYISCRFQGDFLKISPDKIDYMDVSPKQLVSVVAALIPFLEHNDSNRALMGSNMQRQSVPLLFPEPPLIGTGMEKKVAEDSGTVLTAFQNGRVERVSADEIVVKPEEPSEEPYVYKLKKFQRSNVSTCINQRPIVKKGDRIRKGAIIADGPSIKDGELSLGRNLLVAFMPWRGFNFEDAILISEDVIRKDAYTSVSVERFEIECQETKLGPEEITRDIPNMSGESLRKLDKQGIVYLGAEVEPGDILVGKLTPKSESELSPEERLLKAVFGEKASDVKDTSLIVPPGIKGVVINIKVFEHIHKKNKKEKVKELEQIENIKKQNRRARRQAYNIRLSALKKNLIKERLKESIFTKKGKLVLKKNRIITAKVFPCLLPYLLNIKISLSKEKEIREIEQIYRQRIEQIDSRREKQIKKELKKANLPEDGKITLFDGVTGKPFDKKVTVGYIYMMKLNHLAQDKIHARSVGPYSLITQQPLGGKAQFGGQRFGEMEVWALEAYGAAYTLQEMLTVKSDDVLGRTQSYESIVKGENVFYSETPESFNVLIKELQGLVLDVRLEKPEEKSKVKMIN